MEGIRPWRPIVVSNVHRLSEAYRLLDATVAQVGAGQVTLQVRLARDLVLHVLELEGCTGKDVPISQWPQAKPGDIVGDDLGRFLVITRKLRPKWRARRIQERLPGAQIWIDSPRSWAVLLPIETEVQP